MKVACDIIQEQFGADEPELAKNLKLAKLLEANPEILAQMEKVLEIRQRLETERKLRIEAVLPKLPKALVDQSESENPQE